MSKIQENSKYSDLPKERVQEILKVYELLEIPVNNLVYEGPEDFTKSLRKLSNLDFVRYSYSVSGTSVVAKPE